MISRCAREKMNGSINKTNLLLSTCYEIHIITVPNIRHVFQCKILSFQATAFCQLNRLGVLSYVSSNIHNLMQEFLSRVYFSPVSHLFHYTSMKRNQAELGPVFSAANIWDHGDLSKDFRNVDSSKPQLCHQNVKVLHTAKIRSRPLSLDAHPPL